ncbi:hypothetical protein [Oharaeibacter diazotrophicus]|uniref:OmpA family protein n=1 Tax=Oharaeibacter diazotrophicus TaxID=1920512 RepID=A0A4R6RA34_9HYPH|nr:hypothetical protein [Oharaeibacter diazotrophicus]TDP82745.1 hypothetical protein EDD54_4017 [Oharaeibacter diazotrophicus]BBE72493.1 hypothetical protein OHA_1_02088 [Pleomorphomonas sp. SM30]GLS76524.1 hypothetical protein GCM10007904_18610 [Oharaeibacter diazotrophicus]
MADVARDRRADRRGLVLGLTMAEIMLLLVFCLLIALAALLQRERAATTAAEKRVAELERAEAGSRDLLARLGGTEALANRLGPVAPGAADPARPSAAAIDDAWTRLVAGAGLASRLAEAGVDPADLERRDVAADLALADAARAVVAAAGEPPPDAAGARVALDRALDRLGAAEARGDALAREVAALSARAGRPVDLPPILMLREDAGFRFGSGSAVPSARASEKLRTETIATLRDLVDRYDVDVVEVIGHTDDQPVGTTHVSNLDQNLVGVVGGRPIETLSAADNAGLGLARAVSVARILKSDPRLAGVEILPLSAAQLVGTDGRLTAGGGGAEPERRRIEIRLRRSVDRREASDAGR